MVTQVPQKQELYTSGYNLESWSSSETAPKGPRTGHNDRSFPRADIPVYTTRKNKPRWKSLWKEDASQELSKRKRVFGSQITPAIQKESTVPVSTPVKPYPEENYPFHRDNWLRFNAAAECFSPMPVDSQNVSSAATRKVRCHMENLQYRGNLLHSQYPPGPAKFTQIPGLVRSGPAADIQPSKAYPSRTPRAARNSDIRTASKLFI